MSGQIWRLHCVLCIGLAMSVTGCWGEYSSSAVYPVQGSVLVKGVPAAYARVTLVPINEDEKEIASAVGVANEQGEFKLWTREGTGKRRDGARAGAYLVSVSWRIPEDPRSSDTTYSDELLPPRFQDPEQSGLKIEISSRDRELPPIELNP